MSKIFIQTLSLVSIGLPLISSAGVAPVGVWGADASGFVADRFSGSGATGSFNFGNSSLTGGEGFTFDSATESSPEARGSFDSSSQLLNDLTDFFSISTAVQTVSNSTAEASGRAVQEFTYSGASSTSFTVDLNVVGSFQNTTVSPSDFVGNFGTLYVGLQPAFDYFDVTAGLFESWVPDDDTRVTQSEVTLLTGSSITFSVDPGDSFIVYATAYSRMSGPGGSAQGEFGGGFSSGPIGDLVPSSGLVPAIPEPSALGFLVSLAVLGLVARRRRS